MKNTSIIMIGFGSIGKRHYKNLRSLGYKNINVYDPQVKSVNDFPELIILSRLPKMEKYKIAFITSPTHLHAKQAIAAAKSGCHLFIEKPLSHNTADIKKLFSVVKQKKLITMVGCNMRFHPCHKFIKKYIDSKKLGKVYSIRHEFGYYLPFFQPWLDYRKSFRTKKKMGGGIILDGIHEFDLLFWMNNFNEVISSKFTYGKISNLKIKTEDICIAVFHFKNNVLGLVKEDYLQKSYTRNCKIVGEKGNLEWDFNENIVWLKTEEKTKKLFTVKNYDINKMYVDEIRYFLDSVRKKKKTFNDIDTSYTVLKYCIERK